MIAHKLIQSPRSLKMAKAVEREFIKIYIEPENRGKKLNLIEEDVYGDTTISQIREYLAEIRCKQGTLQLGEKRIYQASTLADLQVADGSTFTLKNCQSLNDKSLREVTMKILPDNLTFSMMLPPKISFKLLKFAIECKSLVLASNQVFRKHGEPVKWEESYKCSREELLTVTISDSSKSTMQDSPKSDLKMFLNQHQPKSNSDSEDGSSTNLIERK